MRRSKARSARHENIPRDLVVAKLKLFADSAAIGGDELVGG
jgi:hypothetical protein